MLGDQDGLTENRKLVSYTPLWLGYGDPLASLPAMREWRPGRDSAGAGGFERIVTPRRIYRPARSLEGSEQLTLHTITQCDGSRSTNASSAFSAI